VAIRCKPGGRFCFEAAPQFSAAFRGASVGNFFRSWPTSSRGVAKHDASADLKLMRPTFEFAGDIEPFVGGPKAGDLFQFRFKLHA